MVVFAPPPPPPMNCSKGIILFPSYYRIRLLFPRKLTLVWNIFGKILFYSQSSDGKSFSRVNFPKETGFCRGHTIQEQNPNEFSSQPFFEWFQVLIHSNLSLFVSISSQIVGIWGFSQITLTSDYSKYRDKETPSLPVGFIITEGVTLEQCLITPWYEYHTYTILIQVGAI